MGYSNNPAMVRVDFFKESGKWYATGEMNWNTYDNDELIHAVFIRCLNEQFGDRYKEMIAICLKPYHVHSHPLMIKPGRR